LAASERTDAVGRIDVALWTRCAEENFLRPSLQIDTRNLVIMFGFKPRFFRISAAVIAINRQIVAQSLRCAATRSIATNGNRNFFVV